MISLTIQFPMAIQGHSEEFLVEYPNTIESEIDEIWQYCCQLVEKLRIAGAAYTTASNLFEQVVTQHPDRFNEWFGRVCAQKTRALYLEVSDPEIHAAIDAAIEARDRPAFDKALAAQSTAWRRENL